MFSCLIYAHRLDADTLAKVRSQYLRPLRRRLDARRAAAPAMPGGSRSGTDERQRLEAKLAELDDFDDRLSTTIAHGFASKRIDALLANEPVDRWSGSRPDVRPPGDRSAWRGAEERFVPNPHDGVRVNIAPLERARVLAGNVLAPLDVERAIAERASWRAAERQWCREGKLDKPSWWEP